MAENLVINGVTFPAVKTISADNASGKAIKYHDLSGDTVTTDTLLSGVTAHNAEGEPITGKVGYRIFKGEIVSSVIGANAYALLAKDNVIAEHFDDQTLQIRVRFDLDPTAYAQKETIGFNKSVASSGAAATNIANRVGQIVLRYNASLGVFIGTMGMAINGVNDVGAGKGIGRVLITSDGEIRIISYSTSYGIFPSKYTVEVTWDV